MSEVESTTSVPVPLPTDLPPAPDLAQLPAYILHTGTVETLIGQNEDLMARLKVNIRRNSILEQQIMEQERSAGELMRANTSLMAQLEILQAKDRILREKVARSESLQSEMHGEVELMNAKLEALETRNQLLKSSARFQRRVSRWVRPFIDRLKSQLEKERKALYGKDALISDLRARVSELAQHCQSIENQYTKDQARLVEGYEAQNEALKNELENLKADSKLLREKAKSIDQALASEAASQNRIVFLERQNKDALAQAEDERRRAHAAAAQNASLERKLDDALAESAAARDQVSRLENQFESLKTVWSETQERLEAAKLQHETLNRLNQELSRQLREQRQKDSAQPEVNC